MICQIFGHRWTYYMTSFTPTRYRTCRCGRLQQYISLRDVLGKPKYNWITIHWWIPRHAYRVPWSPCRRCHQRLHHATRVVEVSERGK